MSSIIRRHLGILHKFSETPHLTAFEHLTSAAFNTSSPPRNTLLFLGGLGDGLLHPHYPYLLSRKLPTHWRVVEVLLSSSYDGWTTSQLTQDADEVALAVNYFRTDHGPQNYPEIVLMGHSTGSQICMEYLTARTFSKGYAQFSQRVNRSANTPPPPPPPRPEISGVILQAGISDRENICADNPTAVVSTATKLAHEMSAAGKWADIMPLSAIPPGMRPSPSAERWLSLVEFNGMDDYFSSDLPDEELVQTFGKVGEVRCPILVLLSSKDQYMPEDVDKVLLMKRWEKAVKDAGGVWEKQSGVVDGAGHALEGGADVVDDVARRVTEFLKTVEQRAHGASSRWWGWNDRIL